MGSDYSRIHSMLGGMRHHVKLMIAWALAGLWIVPSVALANGKESVKSVEQLVLELRDPDVQTRQFAALSLGKPETATETVIEALLGALRDSDRAVRTTARYALTQAGPKAAAALKAYEEQRLARLSATLTDPTFGDLHGATIELKRSDCGEDETHWLFIKPCPAYSVRLHGDGAVLYEGQRNVKTLGKQAGLVTFEALRQLLAEFGRAGFLTMPDHYEEGADTERRFVGDIASYPQSFVTTTLTIDGETKMVSRYAGTEEVPNALLELEASIDRAAATKRWIE